MANNENLIPIPGRLHSVATEGHVAGTNEIYDDTLSKDQETINSESAYLEDASSTAVIPSFDPQADSLHKSAQVLSAAEKAQVKQNLGIDGDLSNLNNSILAESTARANAVSAEQSRAQAAEASLSSGKANKATSLSGYGITDAYTKTETYTKTEVNNLITTPNQEYVSVTATSQTTSATDVLPATGAADTTYRVGNWDGTQYNDSVFSEYAWNGSAYIKLSTKSQIGEVYDISANHADTKYADLSAALGTNGANIPQNLRKGGMSVKFVQTSDNKYVQYRLMLFTFTAAQFINTANWQGVDEVPTTSSHNLVESGGVQTAITNVDTKTDFTRCLVFTEGYAYFHPANTDEEGKYIFDGNWTIEVKHQLVAKGFIKSTGITYGAPYIEYNRITIPNGNYNFTYTYVSGYLTYYKIWYNIKTKVFSFGRKPVNDDPYWFEAFEDTGGHGYYYWTFKVEGLIGFCYTSKSSPSNDYFNTFASIKKEYIGDSVYMDNILPDDVSDYPINLDIFVRFALNYRNIDTKFVFSEKLYRISGFPMTNVHIVGAGIDKTIFSVYSATTNEESSGYWATTFHTITIKDCTIKNRGFEQYDVTGAVNKSATFENVKFWVTLGGSSSYLIYTSSKGFKLHIKNCILLNESEGSRMYAGIWTDSAEYVEVINTRIGDYFTRPCANYYAHQAFIDNVDITNGANGIFFAANKNNPLENTIIQNCTVRFVNEECISFDALGNNVAGNPMVCELSITDGEIIQDASGSYINKRLKLYCNARYLVGTHPNEHYEAYSIVEHADLIKKMYVAFDEPAGNVFAGTVVKVLDCGKETDGEEREWVLIDTQLPFEDLNLLENTDITVVNNNYKVAMVTSGFFNIRVTHNKCYGGKQTGIALYNAIYHCTIDNNHVSNCRTGSYLWASKMLATSVYNGACGNIITNNVFEGGEGYGFDFTKFDKVFGYHNIFANNLILNNKGVRITYEKGLTYDGNSIIGPNAILDLSTGAHWGANVVETNKFGTVFPTAPTPGHRFFKTDEGKEYMWNGTEWVE